MVKNNRHIAGFLTLLVCVSLSFASIHNHETLTFNSDRQAAVHHTLDSDSSLCPVCGYLFNAEVYSPPSVEDVVRVKSLVPVSGQQVFAQTALTGRQERAPPFRV